MSPICPPGLGVRQCRHGRLAPGPWPLDRRYWLVALRGTVDHYAVTGFVARGAGPVHPADVFWGAPLRGHVRSMDAAEVDRALAEEREMMAEAAEACASVAATPRDHGPSMGGLPPPRLGSPCVPHTRNNE